jgi:hypothetical protein
LLAASMICLFSEITDSMVGMVHVVAWLPPSVQAVGAFGNSCDRSSKATVRQHRRGSGGGVSTPKLWPVPNSAHENRSCWETENSSSMSIGNGAFVSVSGGGGAPMSEVSSIGEGKTEANKSSKLEALGVSGESAASPAEALGESMARQTSGPACSPFSEHAPVVLGGVSAGVSGKGDLAVDWNSCGLLAGMLCSWATGSASAVGGGASFCLAARDVRPVRLETMYPHTRPRRAQRMHVGFSLLHLTLEFEQLKQLSLSLRGWVPEGRDWRGEGWTSAMTISLVDNFWGADRRKERADEAIYINPHGGRGQRTSQLQPVRRVSAPLEMNALYGPSITSTGSQSTAYCPVLCRSASWR